MNVSSFEQMFRPFLASSGRHRRRKYIFTSERVMLVGWPQENFYFQSNKCVLFHTCQLSNLVTFLSRAVVFRCYFRLPWGRTLGEGCVGALSYTRVSSAKFSTLNQSKLPQILSQIVLLHRYISVLQKIDKTCIFIRNYIRDTSQIFSIS